VGVKTWVNGAFTFSPDGNPLVGPVPGKRGYWCACAVMAGFLQGGGVGKTLAEWMIHGEPEADAWHGCGPLRALGREQANTSADHGAVLFPPLRDDLSQRAAARRPPAEDGAGLFRDDAAGCQWGQLGPRGAALFRAGQGFEETPTLKRSNAMTSWARNAGGARGVGLLDISGFSRFEVTGPNAEAWLTGSWPRRCPNRAARGWRRCWAMTGG
jgi:dimethylglycine dehydrogenase